MQSTKLSGQPVICQLLSYLPKELVDQAVHKFESDRYYKKMTTYRQLVFMFYGVVSKAHSLNSLCKSLLFLDGKLSYLGIPELAASSTLSDANKNRSSEVFEHMYYLLLDFYKADLKGGFVCLPINGEVACEKIKRFDATTFTLFSDVFKGAGREPEIGLKKGGIKAQTVLAFDSLVPEHIILDAAAKNDKDFLGQLKTEKGHIYVFDKGYVNYGVYQNWGSEEVYFVTRPNQNAKHKVLKENPVDVLDIKTGQGVIKDQEIAVHVTSSNSVCKLRLITYKDPESGKVLKFLTNLLSYQGITIALIYKNRWAIEPFFKQLKQNYQLTYFYSDSREGIKTQIWIALIANLIFTIIYQRNKQAEQFITIIAMASANMGSYVCLTVIIKTQNLKKDERNNEKVQLEIFEKSKGGCF